MSLTSISSSYISESLDQKNLDEILQIFQQKSGLNLKETDYEIKKRSDGNYLIVYLCNPTERFFKILNEALKTLSDENLYKERTTLKKRPQPNDRIRLPETQLLRTILSESLTVTQHSFKDDFFARYISSVSGVEQQIIAQANHIVYGRRGSGKSSLLAYLMHTLRKKGTPLVWITMQTYQGRSDIDVVTSVLIEIIDQLKKYQVFLNRLDDISDKLDDLSNIQNDNDIEHQLNRLLPKIKKEIKLIAGEHQSIFIFLDDLHLIKQDFQPHFLSKLYAVCRDNRTFLKISGIEQFIKLWEPSSRQGLEIPHDIQTIKLDYNLTIPDKAKKHIVDILDAHAVYCGLPNIGYICLNNNILSRLVWVVAGVPRDALNIFSQAITYSEGKDWKKVTISSVNLAACGITNDKTKDIKQDASEKYDEVSKLLDKIKKFCISEKKQMLF